MTSSGRFHLTLTTDGRPAMHGWWPVRATADRKFRQWVREQGARPGARIVLVDEETGDVLAVWPDED